MDCWVVLWICTDYGDQGWFGVLMNEIFRLDKMYSALFVGAFEFNGLVSVTFKLIM